MQKRRIIHHGRIGLLSFFASLLNIFRTIDPWAENGQRKQSFRHLQRAEAHPASSPPWRRKRRISFYLGGIFAYRLFEYSNRDVSFEYSKKRETKRSDFRHDGSFRHGRDRSPEGFSGDENEVNRLN
jgi:hypothetical protein